MLPSDGGGIMKIKTAVAIVALFLGGLFPGRGQDAAQPTVDLPVSSPSAAPSEIPAALPSSSGRAQDAEQPPTDLPALLSSPAPEIPANLPSLSPDAPELSKLDEAFKKTSIGKAADDSRQRVEIRKLQNLVVGEPEVVAAKHAAAAARTDLEKRDRLRDYYNLYYGALQRLTSSEDTKKALNDMKAEHLKLLDQPRVRPIPGATLPPVAKEKKTKKKSRFGH
jgi:hypothetical protein